MPVGIGIVGCGTVSHVYMRNLLMFPDLKVVACADWDLERARVFARQYKLPCAGHIESVVEHPEVEIVVNLTTPASHAGVTQRAIAAGKHVYTEKPFALDATSAQQLIADAATAGVLIGTAPDTFLGAGLQAGLRRIVQGDIGEPLSAITMMLGPGPEKWHPRPQFLYQPGAGPLFDMGPYALTVLAMIFGPVAAVAATCQQPHTTRTVSTGPLAGQEFPVEVATHYNVLLTFASGKTAAATFSCDSPLHRFDFLEVTGTEATIALPNPNTYSGPSLLRRAGDQDWTTGPESPESGGRGIGVLEMARALRSGAPHRTGAGNAAHVLEVMTAAIDSAKKQAFTSVQSGYTPAPLLPENWAPASRVVA